MPPDATSPFQIVDGNVMPARLSASGRVRAALHRVPGVDRLLAPEPVQHLAAAVAFAGLVRERFRFVLNEMRGSEGISGYSLRSRERPVVLRHRGADKWTLNEVFGLELYSPPAPVREMMSGREDPTILDLGANIGLFGLDALDRYPGARITAYEPDSGNATVHHELIRRNRVPPARWRLIEACAGPREAEVNFFPLQETAGHVVEKPTPETLTKPMHDVLAGFASADLVKIDIEGGEWPLLADARFYAAPIVVLEYHPSGCPERDAGATVRRMLSEHGYALEPLFEHADGVGMLWAYRAY